MTAAKGTPKNRRLREARLEQILETHEAWERRTLADLHIAGFKFQTVQQAERYAKASRTLARMQPDELVEFVASAMSRTQEASK